MKIQTKNTGIGCYWEACLEGASNVSATLQRLVWSRAMN